MVKHKKAISRVSKFFIVLQSFFILGVLFFFYFFLPHQDFPKNGEALNSNVVDFKFRNANVILIDDNPDFSSPKEVDFSKVNTTKIKFEPGTYFWKAEGDLTQTSARKFTINSNVGLELNESSSSIQNVGDVPITLSEDSDNGLVGLTILDVEVEYPVNVKNKTIYRGAEYEKE